MCTDFWSNFKIVGYCCNSGIPLDLLSFLRKVKLKWSLSHPHAAAAKSLQSCPTLCNPIDGSPPGSSVPGILQARTLEWLAISFSNAWKWKVKVKSLSCARLLATPWTAAYQAPSSMGFSRQGYWSGLPLPSPMSCIRWIKIIRRNQVFVIPHVILKCFQGWELQV